jgi:ribonuclease T1
MKRGAQTLWLILIGLLLWQPVAQARHYSGDVALASVKVADLPAEVRATFDLIRQGGPFPYPRDGIVFGNYERILPQQPRGYYHEYTVKTPGAHNRGARRIVCGIVPECYYTEDHYQSFTRIRE